MLTRLQTSYLLDNKQTATVRSFVTLISSRRKHHTLSINLRSQAHLRYTRFLCVSAWSEALARIRHLGTLAPKTALINQQITIIAINWLARNLLICKVVEVCPMFAACSRSLELDVLNLALSQCQVVTHAYALAPDVCAGTPFAESAMVSIEWRLNPYAKPLNRPTCLT